ncbi:Signal recognition particle, subunit Srp9 [Ceraceosorus bombacis]|uniref:Signal recognition particle, subunit Srp9 n=1 Tax=Ceraceosorus bombacis TaxID=401625 RepID=A0A0P1BLD6_9BASI|nr:Signal recognition particle, subunit Srp9 [Ceraceosorus bombacis]
MCEPPTTCASEEVWAINNQATGLSIKARRSKLFYSRIQLSPRADPSKEDAFVLTCGMVYIKSWVAFHAAAIDIQKAQPERTRYLIKAHPATQSLILKITDDFSTIKFRTRSSIILNRFQALNHELIAQFAGAPKPMLSEAQPGATSQDAAPIAVAEHVGSSSGAVTAQTGTQSGGGSGGGGGGGKKKKKKGKK